MAATTDSRGFEVDGMHADHDKVRGDERATSGEVLLH